MARPEPGSASADRSEIAFLSPHGSPGMVCQAGAALYAEQPLPVPAQTVSALRAPDASTYSVVPPTPMTFVAEAGNSTPYPPSPAEARTAMPFLAALSKAGARLAG